MGLHGIMPAAFPGELGAPDAGTLPEVGIDSDRTRIARGLACRTGGAVWVDITILRVSGLSGCRYSAPEQRKLLGGQTIDLGRPPTRTAMALVGVIRLHRVANPLRRS